MAVEGRAWATIKSRPKTLHERGGIPQIIFQQSFMLTSGCGGNLRVMHRSFLHLFTFSLASLLTTTPGLFGMGSPPLITDDPGTPGDKHWEINLGTSIEKRPGLQASELPLIDLNYGIGDRLQLKYEVPYLYAHEDGSPSLSGFGNSEVGVKWRFYDAGAEGLAAAVYPQWEFNYPGSNLRNKGLVEHGSDFLLPLQFEKAVGPITLVGQVGHEFRANEDSWFYGLSAGHEFGEKLELGVELAGQADAGFHRSVLTTNLGAMVNLNEHSSLMFSVGREWHNHDESKATFLGYVGIQLRL
jgi:hypothetical protein